MNFFKTIYFCKFVNIRCCVIRTAFTKRPKRGIYLVKNWDLMQYVNHVICPKKEKTFSPETGKGGGEKIGAAH